MRLRNRISRLAAIHALARGPATTAVVPESSALISSFFLRRASTFRRTLRSRAAGALRRAALWRQPVVGEVAAHRGERAADERRLDVGERGGDDAGGTDVIGSTTSIAELPPQQPSGICSGFSSLILLGLKFCRGVNAVCAQL